FQRFTLDLGDFVMHPDLVGQLTDGETIFAIEAKGNDDLIKGLAQAEMYQTGFHHTYLAAEATSLGTSLIDFAKRKNVGILAVGDTVSVAHTPQAQMPLREPFRFIERQLDSVWQVSKGQTYQYNIPTLASWAEVHSVVGSRSSSTPLANHRPQVAADLRLLLLQDPMVRLVISGLEEFPTASAHFADLAQKCDQLDHACAPVFFLKPESAAALTDDRGRISWANATGQDYRSRMFYQYKSILKHAGILTPRSLGGASTKTYDPTHDIWELR
ncbi:hypothetical protein IQ273_28125, partial [Nodosilinea sp. LEGE 07298]|uniref:hypothetical protein n=1 Tax=Nodosilinea sp. LEGE 07298 TaxID=2777970 RepID=UPI0018820E8F